jgi:hypothetical protein
MPVPPPIPLLLTVTDGRASWQAVVDSFRQTLDDPWRGLPLVSAVAAAVLFVWINCRLARWVIRQWTGEKA